MKMYALIAAMTINLHCAYWGGAMLFEAFLVQSVLTFAALYIHFKGGK